MDAAHDILANHYVELNLISITYGIDISNEQRAAKELERVLGPASSGASLEEMKKKFKVG